MYICLGSQAWEISCMIVPPTSMSLGKWFQQWVDPSYGSRFSQQLLSLSAHWPARQGQPIHGSARQEFLLWFPDASSSFVFPMTALTSRSLLGQGTKSFSRTYSAELYFPAMATARLHQLGGIGTGTLMSLSSTGGGTLELAMSQQKQDSGEQLMAPKQLQTKNT